jgi:hypothetical protein
MKKNIIMLCLLIILIFVNAPGWTNEDSPNRLTVMKLIDQIPSSAETIKFCSVSPDGKHVIYVIRNNDKEFVLYDGKKEKLYDEILPGTPIFSPDSHSSVYVAREGNQWFVVLNGKEGKRYDKILENMLTFSQNSEHLAYIAAVDNAHLVVVDGKESSKYHGYIHLKVDKKFFHAPDRFHYFVFEGHDVYYVEETIL